MSGGGDFRNPFPGLRPFREDEEFLFFGRENQVDAMVDKLAVKRFLAVVGTSGSGKSSLVNCGLRPALHGGLMATAGTSWRMAQFRPGSDPLGAMAAALAEDGVLFSDYQGAGLTLTEIVDTTLRMSTLGLIDIYEQAQLGAGVNLLVVVDQFEELFRYRKLGTGENEDFRSVAEEATAFVNLLLEAKSQTTHPIHVVLTMRSDFLGDCAQFTGLAEAINEGQYLVPRMTRDERRAAIRSPVDVSGIEISPILLTRLVNDVGDNPDQLSILQHALNRTWAHWDHVRGDQSLDLDDYQAIGTMAHALDQHAEQAYAELNTPRKQPICERVFKALTDKATDARGVRRPTTLATLCALANASEAEVTEVMAVFRDPRRSFLMPPAGEPLQADTVIDISHESLMRVWERLKTWADEEAQSAQMFRRLATTSALHAEDKASLWRDPDLQLALDWRAAEQPTAAWAALYQGRFDPAMSFLDQSKRAHDDEVAKAEFERESRLIRNVLIGLVLALFFWNLWAPATHVDDYKIDGAVLKALRTAGVDVLGDEDSDPPSDAAPEAAPKPVPRDDEVWVRMRTAVTKALTEGRQADGEGGYHDPEHVQSALEGGLQMLPGTVGGNAARYVLRTPVSVVRREAAQTELIRLVFLVAPSGISEALLRKPHRVTTLSRVLPFLAHFLGYLALLVGVGFVHRRFAWRTPVSRAGQFLKQLQSPRWRVTLSRGLLLAGVILCIAGVGAFVPGIPRVLIALPGLILVLAVSPRALLKGRWVPRARVAQGMLLRLLGFYALAASVVVFIEPTATFPVLGRQPNPWLLVIAGLGLVILGKRKYNLTPDEALLREPNRAPVVYLRSVGDVKRGQKATWTSRISLFKPTAHQVLGEIFGVLGPFVALQQPGASRTSDVDPVASAEDTEQGTAALMRRSALLVVQIDDDPTDAFCSKIAHAVQTVDPEQLLVYFSQKLDDERLRVAYHRVAEAIRGVLPCALPPSIGSNHFLAFDEGWQPRVFGPLARPRFSLERLMPVLGSKVAAARMRRSTSRALRPLFESRGVVKPKTKLYSDGAISLAAFPLIGLGIPAGLMMCGNLWRVGRRWAASVFLVLPFVCLVATLFGIAWLDRDGAAWLVTALLVMLFVGSPSATHWLWRRSSGRAIRRHIAFGGDGQPLWKVLLVLVLGGGLLVWGPLIAMSIEQTDYQSDAAVLVEAAQDLVWERSHSKSGESEFKWEERDFESVVLLLRRARHEDPDIDLDPETLAIDTDPEAVAAKWMAIAQFDGAGAEGALGFLEEAQAYTVVDLKPIGASLRVEQGRQLADEGNFEQAVAAYRAALALDETVDLDPYTDEIESDPAKAVARVLVERGAELAWEGRSAEAIAAYKAALALDATVDLVPDTPALDHNPEAALPKRTKLAPHDPDREGDLRPAESEHDVMIGFLNRTKVECRLEWVGFEGDREEYGVLPAGESMQVWTFATHPWIVTDVDGEVLGVYVAEKEPVLVEIR